MLNYIWLSLILLGIIAALSTDLSDIFTDRYRNEKPIDVILTIPREIEIQAGKEIAGELSVNLKYLDGVYDLSGSPDTSIALSVHLVFSTNEKALVEVDVRENAPQIWLDIARAQSNNEGVLKGQIFLSENLTGLDHRASLILDPVRFSALQCVTNDGIVGYAGIAVTIALGLIGIMALWLGVMKVAEEAGLVQTIASGLKPVMTRLFPDVPSNHPAMGAMILNIAANMLGLANAATPLGLKAMEELNKLNKKVGTATDAMCTFLVINTSSVQLIPATVIAIRAAAGSANPTEILVPIILATSASTIAGIIAVKLLQRLPVYRKQLQD